ncbi:MAG: siroheme synthase CysG, partial [Proteobacteria bacterium]|nr:siroheme synthase CysG [Pseudomonadota bacterium]
MPYFPLFLKLQDRPCLVVGGGEVAARKTQQLLKAGAQVTVLALEIGSSFEKTCQENDIVLKKQGYDPALLEGIELVIAATDDNNINKQVARDALAKSILVNVVDDPDSGSFIMPSVVDRNPVMIAVSTGGASPVLARLLRARLETLIPASYGKLASLISRFRDKVKKQFPTIRDRRRFWEKILQGPIAEMLYAGQEKKALSLLEQQLDQDMQEFKSDGEVYLVGGGPGDPDLLTFRALRLMQQADVVLYDRLVAPEIVELVRKDAERIYVGKERSNHSLPQQEINQLLVDLAKQGKRVLRLKGGDPFIFGRGGEEIDLLSKHNIPFQIVPGITAASGCASYAGIPLTHRDFAQSCLSITGHLKDGSINLNWPALVQPQQTLAV